MCPHCVQVGWDDTEAEFWRVVESSEEPVEVLCGASLDTASNGSGFPQVRIPELHLPNLHASVDPYCHQCNL